MSFQESCSIKTACLPSTSFTQWLVIFWQKPRQKTAMQRWPLARHWEGPPIALDAATPAKVATGQAGQGTTGAGEDVRPPARPRPGQVSTVGEDDEPAFGEHGLSGKHSTDKQQSVGPETTPPPSPPPRSPCPSRRMRKMWEDPGGGARRGGGRWRSARAGRRPLGEASRPAAAGREAGGRGGGGWARAASEAIKRRPLSRRRVLPGWAAGEASRGESGIAMREIVHIQAGQCGNQIGTKVSLRAAGTAACGSLWALGGDAPGRFSGPSGPAGPGWASPPHPTPPPPLSRAPSGPLPRGAGRVRDVGHRASRLCPWP